MLKNNNVGEISDFVCSQSKNRALFLGAYFLSEKIRNVSSNNHDLEKTGDNEMN